MWELFLCHLDLPLGAEALTLQRTTCRFLPSNKLVLHSSSSVVILQQDEIEEFEMNELIAMPTA